MLNLTPHAITIIGASGESVTIPPSGTVARVLTQERDEGFTIAGQTCDGHLLGDGYVYDDNGIIVGEGIFVPLASRSFGNVEGIPPAWERGIGVLVSAMVLEACKASGDTAGIFAPDTGPTAIRENGQIVAVRRLIAA